MTRRLIDDAMALAARVSRKCCRNLKKRRIRAIGTIGGKSFGIIIRRSVANRMASCDKNVISSAQPERAVAGRGRAAALSVLNARAAMALSAKSPK